MARLVEMRGNEGPVNEGERRVVAALLQRLPDGYWIAPNVEIAEPGGQRFEYDAIVVTPHAVFVVETKDWHGHIVGDEREWLVNGVSRRAPFGATERKAKVLKSKLVSRAPALGRVWVEGIICVSSGATLDLTPEAARRTFDIDALVRFLQDPTAIGRRPDDIRDLTNQILRMFTDLVGPRRGPLMFRGYEVIERLEQTADETIYRARRRDMPAAPPVRLRVVAMSAYAMTEEERAQRRAILMRETEALLRMGSHPNIVAAREAFEDDGNIVLVQDDLETRTLRTRLSSGSPLTFQERLDVVISVCRALTHAHANGVTHRHVEPAEILLSPDGSAKLGGFGLAKISAAGAATVWDDEVPVDLDQRYLAPELANSALGPVGPPTDLYELGCVAYELFSGAPPFENALAPFRELPALPPETPPELVELLQDLLRPDPAARPQSASEVLARFEQLRPRQLAEPASGPKENYLPGDLIDAKFEVRSPLGEGGFGNVYRVYYAIDDREYALKVFNFAVDYEKVRREIDMLRRLDHPRIVKAVWADRTSEGQWYLVTELITGENLSDYTTPRGGKRLSPAETVQITCQLLAVLEAIHPNALRIAELEAKGRTGELDNEEYEELGRLKEHGIIHRDIKPQNLMLTQDGIMLLDFGIASRVGQPVVTVSGTPPYRAPDILAGMDTWDVSADLFAVGVVLYELFCLEHPYEEQSPRPDREPRDPLMFREDLSGQLAAFLKKACAAHRVDRFGSAREMRIALEAIDPLLAPPPPPGVAMLPSKLRALLASHPQNVNPMVREFLRLSSQARRSNEGTRGLDDLARATYVETRLDAELCSSILQGRHRLVIVTGNAGDGKTAFIQQVERAAQDAGAQVWSIGMNGGSLSYQGREIRTLYDGSQDEAELTSDSVLEEFLSPFADDGEATDDVRLAAINEGRLRDFLLVHRQRFGAMSREVIGVLDDPQAAQPGRGIMVVNLNLRSVTAGGSNSILTRQLMAIVGGPFWGPCDSCDYRTRCPLKHNIDTFRDSTSGPATTERLRQLVDLVRLRRRRHITMRDVRSLVSHLLFRDRTCEEVPELLASDDPLRVVDLTYFQGPGGLGVPEGSALERGAELMSMVDVALVANPEDDLAIANRRGPRLMQFPDRTSENYPASLIAVAQDRAGRGYEGNPAAARRAHEAARRMVYFERMDDAWWQMVPYTRLRELQTALTPDGQAQRARLRDEVMVAISRAQGMDDERRVREALWLSTSVAESSEYRCFRSFTAGDFRLVIAAADAPYVETEPDRLAFVHEPTGAELAIDLDLLEVLERLGEGFVPTGEDEGNILINLSLFKNRLLAAPSSELVMLTGDEFFRIGRAAQPGSITLVEEPL